MIVIIDPNTFLTKETVVLQSLAQIIRRAIKRRFLWDTTDVSDLFELIEQTDWYQHHLSNNDKKELEEELNRIETVSTYITALHKKYLTTIIVGLSADQINPVDAEILLSTESNVILENGINDFKFIEGLSEKYSNHKDRKTLYKPLFAAIKNRWIVGENAGGKGEIKKLAQHWLERHGPHYRFKLATIFDSDRSKQNEILPAQLVLIKFLKKKSEHEQLESTDFEENDAIVWHMLSKREIENYLPIDLIQMHYPSKTEKCKDLNSKSQEELDYLDFEAEFEGIDVKTQFPKLFLDERFRKDKFENRCLHHQMRIELPNGTLEVVSELEVILLKLVKIL